MFKYSSIICFGFICLLVLPALAEGSEGHLWFKTQSATKGEAKQAHEKERPRLASLKNPTMQEKKTHHAVHADPHALTNQAISTGISATKDALVKNARERGDEAMAGFWSRFWLDASVAQRQVATYALTTVQPLYESDDLDDTIFTQLRFAAGHHSEKDRYTANVGLGYRRFFMDKKVMLGINGFIDHEWPYNHHRLGVGAELRTSFLDLTANGYVATSTARSASNNMKERALNGYDLEVGVPLPYLPTTRIYVKHFHWDTRKLGKAIGGQTYTFRMEVFQDMFFEAGYSKDNHKTSHAFMNVNMRIPLGEDDPIKTLELVSDQPYEFTSVENQRLWKVRRNNNIVVERYSSTGGATVNVVKAG